MIDKYLLDNGEKVLNSGQLRKGEVYFEEFALGYRGFIMPGKERISENGHLRLVGIPVYIVMRLGEKGTINVMTLDLGPHQFEEENTGHAVFRAREDSEVRRTLLEKLPKIA